MSKQLLNLCLAALLSVVSTAAWALDKVDGVYQISTAEDLKAFAELVNGSEPTANAVLTADIDKGTETYRIGRDGQDYQGVFDGAGHTITYNMTFMGENGAGLFRNVGIHALIKNLKVQGTLASDGSFAGGLVGYNKGRISGCYVDVDIMSSKKGDATDGGIVGMGYNGTLIENCIAHITIQGEETTNCGGVVGWADSKLNVVNSLVVSDGSTLSISNGSSANIARNGGNVNVVNLSTYNANPYANRPAGANYNNYVTQQWGNNNATTVVPLADLADGKICYQLNHDQSEINWVQKIGTDPFPVPVAFGSLEDQVFASGPTGCNGKADGLTYSNTGTVQATAHTFDKYGICTTCGCFNFDCLEYNEKENTFLIGSVDDIYLAEGWNRVTNGLKVHMKMTSDITINAPSGQLIFNNGNWVDGDFNGDGHTLTIAMADITDNYASFIPQHTGVFENVIMHGTITTTGQYAGSISGEARQSAVRNVYSDITINANRNGDNTSGGFFGMIRTGKHIDNCIYAGNLNTLETTSAPSVGGFSGWTHEKTYFTNCAFLGNITGGAGKSDNSANISRNWGSIECENVYVANPLTGPSVTDQAKYTHYTNTEGIANGELAFFLNGKQNGVENFYQVIGTDPQPLPVAREGGLVYAIAANYRCDGQPIGDEVTYTNSATVTEFPPHEYEDGLCKNCGQIEIDADGYKKIINARTLVAFSNLVNAGSTNVNARVYADIDMTDVAYDAFGSEGNMYVGEFDGQGHTIKGLVINNDKPYQGLIGAVSGGAVVKDITLDETCSIKCNRFGGLIGGAIGSGNVYITNVGNKGNVTCTNQNASGIIGVDWLGAATLHITNCFVTGHIKGGSESATICSWSNDASVVENCWSIASLEGIYGKNSFTRGGTTVTNCYEIEGVAQQNANTGRDKTNVITAQEVADGILCYKLNSPAFGQLIGTDAHPVFGGPEVSYVGDAGYATLYDAKTGYELNGDVKAYVAVLNSTWLDLNEIPNIPAGTPVVLKGGYYNKLAADLPAINVANDLKGTNSATTADGTMYILAKVGDQVGFYKAEGTIPAGKAYYQSESGAKAFFFGGDDATGISEVESSKLKVESPIYNIAGQRLQKMQKGINIINGKKVLK